MKIFNIILLLTLTSLAKTRDFHHLEFRKCRYCDEGMTHHMLKFMKYDLPKYKKNDIKLKFQIEDGSKPKIVSVGNKGEIMKSVTITGFTLEQMRQTIKEFGVNPKETLQDIKLVDEEWDSVYGERDL